MKKPRQNMENREFKSKRRYFYAFVIATTIFVLIFLLSYSISFFEFQRISNLQGETAYSIFEKKLDFSLFNQGSCSQESFKKISEDLRFQGRIMDDLERKLGKNDARVLFRKKFYTLVELEHLEFVKKIKEDCNSNLDTMLFFYSNEKSDLQESEEVGRMLGTVNQDHEGLLIYSFDINLDSELIGKLKSKYGISETSVVINEDAKVILPKNREEIERYLD